MIWLIPTIVVYLIIGFKFDKPKEWSMFTKIMAHIFWAPLLIAIYIIIKNKGFKL